MASQDSQNELSRKLDDVIRLLEDLLILQGFKLKLGTEAIRALVKVDRTRVTRISKLIKKSVKD